MAGLVLLIPSLSYTQSVAEPDPDEDSKLAAPVEKTPPESNYIFRQAALAEPWELEDPDPAISTKNIVIIAFLTLAGILIVCRNASDLIAALKTEFKPWLLTPATAMGLSADVRAEDRDYTQFLVGFKEGPDSNGEAVPDLSGLSEEAKVFFTEAPNRLSELRLIVQQIDRSQEIDGHREALGKLANEIKALKDAAGLRELLPIWQLASALEGLLKQLTQRANNLTSSTLRTVVNGVALFDELCKPGVDSRLLTNPPITLLAVDDELISRRAVDYALKKALGKPDMAEEGQAGLTLAEKQPYDIIFLDVIMPGMDGFELFSRIRQTEQNRETPVVFVTGLNDFEARQSILKSGCDLIGKPFLTFEITVKALTLILKRRLKAREEEAKKRKAEKENGPISAAVVEQQNALATSKSVDPRIIGQYTEKLSPPASVGEASQVADGIDDANGSVSQNGHTAQTVTAVTTPAPEPEKIDEAALLLEREFLALIFKELDVLRRRTIEIFETPDNESRFQMLADLYLDFRELMPKACPSPFHPALRLCARLEALLKKLVEQPSHCTSSTLLTIHTAFEVVGELCAPEVQPSLAVKIPIRLLVVDDDPVMRRAITGALQVAFEKPECAENGETAVALAGEKPFDAVFMDIEMPGMDGFNACMKIHSTPHNWNTPVVFVTGHSDFKSRTHAAASGGSDFIGKPFLTAEVTLKALTYALRGRLQKRKFAESGVQFPNGADARTQKAHEAKDRRRSSRKSSKHRKSKSSKAKMAKH